MNKAGFTLIETILYVAIIGSVIASFVSFGIAVNNTRDKNYVVQEVQANTRAVLKKLNQTIRSASGVNVTSSTFDSDPGVLSLIMSSSTLDPTTISLNQDNGALQITQGLGSPINITSNKIRVSNLIFSNLATSSTFNNIGINLTIEYNNNFDVIFDYSQTVQTAVSLRH